MKIKYPYTKPQSPTPFNSNSHPSHFCTKLWSKTLGGRPRQNNNHLYISRKAAKKRVRQIQRQDAALKREKLYNDISQAHIDKDQKLFFRLVNKQRNTKTSSTDRIIVNGQSYEEYDNIIEGWHLYFEALSQPKENPKFDEQYKSEVEFDVNVIESICSAQGKPVDPVSNDEIQKVIANLKNNKAADYMGLCAEHFKMASQELVPYITDLVNKILSTSEVPHILKLGHLTPILKKGKEKTVPGNYRGITVTSLIGKILEACLKTRLDDVLGGSQNALQRGFTEGVSPLHAGLIISEAFFEAKDQKSELMLQALDADKAFDIVWHNNLFRKLYMDGVEGDLWLLTQSLHKDARTMIKWEGELSEEIVLQQGIRQGAKLSTLMYKRFNNGLLDQIQECKEGTKIGASDVTSPTCADDIALLSQNSADAQILTNTIENASKRDRFIINPSKSELVKFKTTRKCTDTVQLFIGQHEIKQVSQATHLGIERNETNTPDVQKRIETARKTLYALMGSGMHGRNGISPAIAVQMWSTFVIPRLLHGIELLNIRRKDIEDLEIFQRKVLRQIQSLPDRTASVAVLALIGAKPIEAQIDIRILTTFLNIAMDPCQIEHQLALRQLATKSDQSHSWFIKVKHILCKYNLPEPMHLLQSIRSDKTKLHWKFKVKKQVNDFWHDKHVEDIQGKSSLKFLKVQEYSVNAPHPVWLNSKNSPCASRKAAVKAKLLTDTYRLQSKRAKFNQYQVDPTCPLCGRGDEDREHFLMTCSALHDKRDPYLEKLRDTLSNSGCSWQTDTAFLIEIVLDCSDQFRLHSIKNTRQLQNKIEKIGRERSHICIALQKGIPS